MDEAIMLLLQLFNVGAESWGQAYLITTQIRVTPVFQSCISPTGPRRSSLH